MESISKNVQKMIIERKMEINNIKIWSNNGSSSSTHLWHYGQKSGLAEVGILRILEGGTAHRQKIIGRLERGIGADC